MTSQPPPPSPPPAYSFGSGDLRDASQRRIWLGEQECFSWGVTVWTALGAAVVAGWVARVLTRNAVPRSA